MTFKLPLSFLEGVLQIPFLMFQRSFNKVVLKTVAIRVPGIFCDPTDFYPFLFTNWELPLQDPCWPPSLQHTSSFLSLVHITLSYSESSYPSGWLCYKTYMLQFQLAQSIYLVRDYSSPGMQHARGEFECQLGTKTNNFVGHAPWLFGKSGWLILCY